MFYMSLPQRLGVAAILAALVGLLCLWALGG
jgi:hypothetical protein